MARPAAALAFAALLAVAGCAGDGAGDGRAAAPSTTSDRSRTEVSVASPDATSSVSSGGTAVETAVEVRVGETLTDLRATETPEGTVIVLPEKVLFEFGAAELRPDAAATLDRISEVIAFYAGAPVSIRGHTDAVGSDTSNQDLSERRAEAVRAYLAGRPDADASRLKAVGLGETEPVASNAAPDGADDPAGREQNRRVEIVVQGVRR